MDCRSRQDFDPFFGSFIVILGESLTLLFPHMGANSVRGAGKDPLIDGVFFLACNDED